MGKVKQMLQEFEEINGPLEEPTDEELQSIEAEIEFLENWMTTHPGDLD